LFIGDQAPIAAGLVVLREFDGSAGKAQGIPQHQLADTIQEVARLLLSPACDARLLQDMLNMDFIALALNQLDQVKALIRLNDL
jgi:hypothetical protein